jgi:hypothetical protein
MAFTAKLDPLQSQVFREIQPGTVLVLAMGRGTGKSFLNRTALHALAFNQPGIEIGLLLPSLKQAKMVFWPHLINDYTGPLKGLVRTNMSDLTAVYKNGSRLSTWGAENAHSIRGQRFGAVLEDECDDIDPATETAVVQPTFSRSGRSAIWLKSGTPRRGRHGILFRDFELGRKRHETAGLRYRSFRFRSDQSPQVDQVWLQSVKAITNPAVYSREYECDFDSGEGLVYPFDEDFHVRPPPDGAVWSEILIGCDHGYEDPGVLVLIGVLGHGADATCWVLEEAYESHQLEDWWVAKLSEWTLAYPNHKFYGDPSMPSRIEAYRKRARARVQEVDNSIEDGIGAVANRMFIRERDDMSRAARFYVDPSCENTIREFKTYRRKRDPRLADSFLETPEDKANHVPDAVRYAIFNRFGPSDTSGRIFNRYDARS